MLSRAIQKWCLFIPFSMGFMGISPKMVGGLHGIFSNFQTGMSWMMRTMNSSGIYFLTNHMFAEGFTNKTKGMKELRHTEPEWNGD